MKIVEKRKERTGRSLGRRDSKKIVEKGAKEKLRKGGMK